LERQRLDKWLWHARVVKARTSAAALVEAGHVRINGVREKAPGHAVKLGDVLTIGLDRAVRVLEVVGFSERRGDAEAARVLYNEVQARPQAQGLQAQDRQARHLQEQDGPARDPATRKS
jgi:ribosome-associated heat shock protein Hsp15